jgi:hypothetical protein
VGGGLAGVGLGGGGEGFLGEEGKGPRTEKLQHQRHRKMCRKGKSIGRGRSDEDERVPPQAAETGAFDGEVEQGAAGFLDAEFGRRRDVMVASVVGFADAEVVVEEAAGEVGAGDAAETWWS